MVLLDVNILVYAHRQDAPEHRMYLDWLTGLISSDEAYGLSDMVLSGLIRIATHPRIFDPPSRLAEVLAFTKELREQANCIVVNPGPRHWDIFCRLCQDSNVKGNLVPDAFLAAIAIESGSEWITTDRDFSRFNGLRWRHPLRSG